MLLLLVGACSSGESDSTVSIDDSADDSTAESETSSTSAQSSDDDSASGGVDETAAPDDESASEEDSSQTETETTVVETTTTTEAAPEQPALPQDCLGLDAPLLPVQVTFSAEDKLFGIGFDGQPTCLLFLDPGSGVVAWSPQADKVLLSDGRVEVFGGDVEGQAADGVARDHAQFSRPTGFNLIWISGETVEVSNLDGGFRRALDLGVPIDEVDYHPDGKNLVLVAEDPAFSGDSVWVTGIEGQEGRPLLYTSDGAQISELAISYDGAQIILVVSHPDGSVNLLRFDMSVAARLVEFEDGEQEVVLDPSGGYVPDLLHEAATPLTDLTLSGDSRYVALAEGTCESGRAVEIIDLEAGGYPLPIMAGRSGHPIGFNGPTELLVAVDLPDCGPVFDLYAVDVTNGDERLIRARVDSAAIRRIDPPPAFGLAEVSILPFAI